MKISHLLLAAVSLSLTFVSARASTLDNNSDSVRLPAYSVEATRQTAAEREVARSLDEMRAAARTPLAIKPEIPMLSAPKPAGHDAAKNVPLLVIAKS